MSTVVITGGSRGLGLELVRLLATNTSIDLVITTSRSHELSAQLSEIMSTCTKVSHVQLETTDQTSITTAASQIKSILGDRGLDILINNAGVGEPELNGPSAWTKLSYHFNVNVVGTYNVTIALLPFLRQSKIKKLVHVSSTIGSFGLVDMFAANPSPSYKISKAALNMLAVQQAIELGKEGITVFCLSPGWLKTDLGGEGAYLDAHVGAKATWEIVEKATERDHGRFRNIWVEGWDVYDGEDAPW